MANPTGSDQALLDQAHREQALAVLGLVEDQIEMRQEAIIKKLVGMYYSGTLTGDEARSGIAGIAEIRKLVSDLRRVAGESTPG